MKQYIDLCKRIIEEGVWVENKRTGKKCLTIINADFEYDLTDDSIPMLTTKKVYWHAAIAEMLGYIKGFQSAAQFRELGCNTWNANANENGAWLKNRYREGEDDMGRVYGVQGRSWINAWGSTFDQFKTVYEDLKAGNDNRREIVTFYNPGELDRGCLAPCMHTHMFSVLDDTLYLTSYQRSCDVPLGVPFNMTQVGFLLRLMAHITGLKPGKAFHKMGNVHIYEDQLDGIVEQVIRTPLQQPRLFISSDIKNFADVDMIMEPSHCEVRGYESHPAIQFAFSV